ncbi:hypothetical protein IMPR6_240001 [Imperialibacter sp. EC-SDR9]|nr:hypothetical protein IMPERIA89_590001 [Imperialibacter sp. 89]VVT15866.1 hypothetical protein IMPR6_240001 [Imperialibacter sp. EC-SDR9]
MNPVNPVFTVYFGKIGYAPFGIPHFLNNLSSINKTLKYWGGKIDKTSALVYI